MVIIHAKDVRIARDYDEIDTRLCLYSHAILLFLTRDSRFLGQKPLTKPRVCVIIFPASERVLSRSNQIFRGIAQLVEQRSPKPRAEGSSPSAPAKLKVLEMAYLSRF